MTQFQQNSGSFLAGFMVRLESWHSHPGSKNTLPSKCSDWLRMRSPPKLRVCVYEVWKVIAPIIYFGGAVVAMVLFSLTDKLHSFVSRIFIPQYHYPYAVPLTFIQVLIVLLALLALHGVGLLHLKPFSLPLAERLLVPAVCGSAQAVLALWAEASGHSGLYPLIGRLLPLLSLAFGHLLAIHTPASASVTCLVTAVTVASVSITVYNGMYAVETLEWLYSPLSLILHTISLVWLVKVAQSEKLHTSPFDLFYTLTVNRTVLLAVLCLLHPDSSRAVTDGNWHSLLFLGYMLGMLLLGALQLLLVDMVALRFSVLPATLLHSARGLLQPFCSML
ncbi:uncharacterized protein si:ch211-248a14.8 [Chanos chanos]|uniref:Uncharacterized protein si:ch211-248a14.8 n=1 Tax=Chanos chanos TaxID=29144 RepID=A0A6J2WBV2_CHACN|nr:uncharacterized protein LOC115822266 [Chanos chanos]